MLLSVILPLLLAQATLAQASSAPQLPPEWKATAVVNRGQYLRYERQEADGTQSTLSATKQHCDCMPSELVSQLTTVFASLPKAAMTHETVSVCGSQAEHLIVTGVAGGSARNNIDAYAFRKNGDLYVMTYTFKAAAPAADADAALLMLCAA